MSWNDELNIIRIKRDTKLIRGLEAEIELLKKKNKELIAVCLKNASSPHLCKL